MKQRKHVVMCVLLTCILAVMGVGIWFGLQHKRASDILESVEWYNLEDKEFTITSKEELYDVAMLSQYYDFQGQTIYLGADIAVNEGDASKWEENAPESVWTPIINFVGTLDGKGHTISGIYAVGINQSVGLFTDTQAACELKDFRLENSYIKGLNDKGTGSIIGTGTGTLSSIYSNAIVVCESDNVGGLIGYLKATKTSEMGNCWFDGSIEATSELAHYTGGLVGRILANTSLCKISHCLNTANVKSQGQEIGGLIGAVAGETTMWLTDCLNVGDVDGPEGSLTAGMAIGKLYGSATVNSRTSWVVKGNYVKAIGTSEGTVKGVLATVTSDEVQGYDAYVNTTLDFDKYWAVVEADTPVLTAFAETIPSIAGLERKYDLSWFDEKTTQMHISTVAQLNGFALLSQAYGFTGQTIILDSDIVLNEGNASSWIKNAPENEWTMPIGRWISEDGVTSGVAFSGTFDGNGHTISGLYINLDSQKAYNWGLFAKTKGTIKNVSLKNSYITGLAGGNVGSIAGGLEGGTLENVYSNAILDMDTWRIGGLTGIIEGRGKESTITNCWFDGSVTGRERVGGFVGNINQDVALKISHSLNSGSITGISHYIGGFVGIINKCTSSITDCLNTGTITRAEGNRTGYYGAISGGVNGSEGLECEATFKNVFYLDDSCTKGYQVDRNNAKYVTLIGNGAIQLNEEELTGKNAYVWSALDFKTYWTTVNNDMPLLRTFAKAKQSASGNKMADYSWYSVSAKNYTIKNPRQFWAFSILSRTDDFKDKTVNLGATVLLNDTTNPNWYEAEGLINWKPIGRNVTQEGKAIGKAFAGTFNGNGHKISGLYIKLDSTKAFNWGLFAKTSGKIQNLKLVDSHISGIAGGSVGSITGSMAGATLENVYSNATVEIASEKANTGKNIAGLAGIIEGKASSVISNCWFDGSVSGVQRVGGFVGSIDAASDLAVSHGLNTGSIASSSNYVGGFVGLMNKSGLVVTDSLNLGEISTTSKTSYIGAIAGGLNGAKDAEGKATFTNVYFLEDSAAKAYQTDNNNKKYVSITGNGAVLLKEEELKGNNAYAWSNLDFDKYWTTVENNTPMLQTFAKKTQKSSGEKMVAYDWHKLEATSHKISNEKELWGFTLLSRTDDFSGEKVLLVADIDLKKAEWKPIGRYVDEEGVAQGKTFAGTFNGQGHEITGLYIKLEGTKANNWGLFAKVSGKIQNLKLVDSEITGEATGSVGSITGSMAGAVMENIYSNATITIASDTSGKAKNIAGLAGIIEGKASSVITNCWFAGSVSGVERVGGFAGSIDAESELSISHSLNSGTVTSSSNYVGGFVGLMNKSGIFLTDCLNTGTVSTTSGTAYVGALVGGLNGANGAEGKAAFDDAYYMLESSTKPYQVNANNKNYVILSGMGALGVPNSGLLGDKALYSTTLDFKTYWMTVEAKTPTLRLLEKDAITGNVSADISWYSEEETDFTITTKEQLCGLTLLSQKYDFKGQTITLGDNIDLTGISWEPIGKHEYASNKSIGQVFAGTFDGGNYTITGLTINVTSGTKMYGLFGQTSGTIQNLTLEDCTINGTASGKVGSVVGSMNGGTLTNVHSTASIDVKSNFVGGLVGCLESNKTGALTNCSFTGSVEGDKHIGGLVGFANTGAKLTITEGNNSAAVSTKVKDSNVGGLVGYVQQSTATITGSVNKGTVSNNGYKSNCGTIIGNINGDDTGSKKAIVTFTNVTNETEGDVAGYMVDINDVTSGFVVINGYVADINWYLKDEGATIFTINTREQLFGLVKLSESNNFEGKTIKLGNDIDLSGTKWTPIGKHKNGSNQDVGVEFKGTFDGEGHKILGLSIQFTGKEGYQGLFGTLSGTVQNLKLESVTINGKASNNRVGSVAGTLKGGTLKNIQCTATINVETNQVGGFVGSVEGSNKSTIERCIFTGSVRGSKNIGGLVGWITASKLDVLHSQNNGAVSNSASQTKVGGLCGFVDKGSTVVIRDSLNNGIVTPNAANDLCGEIVGYLDGASGKATSLTLTNVYYLASNSNEKYTVNTANEAYITISDGEGSEVKTVSYNADIAWYTTDANVSNFTVATKEQLIGMALLSEKYDFAGETIALSDDISLNDTTNNNWYESASSWKPIGKHKNGSNQDVGVEFKGTFDGEGHKILGLNIQFTGKEGYQGLFGTVSGTIQNLILENVRITGKASNNRVGSVAGTLKGGTLRNIHCTTEINAETNQVGGLIGSVEGGTTNIIEKCMVSGSVSGTKNIGGIAGWISQSTIQISDCLNRAHVIITNTSGDSRVGGICGYVDKAKAESKIENCLNTGTITATGGTPMKGAIVGVYTGTNLTFANAYYLKVDGLGACASPASPSGCSVVTENELKNTTNTIALGFYNATTNPDGAWIRDENNMPILKPLVSTNN